MIRSGGTLFGSNVSLIGTGNNAINDFGQIAFHYLLANGATGIARADPITTPGEAPWNPLLPDMTDGSTFVFFQTRPLPRLWYDPPLAQGFHYQLVGGGQFLEVMGPPGFFDLDVMVNGLIVESDLDSGESYFFGPSVADFSILGITPAVDAASPTAFPTFLDFSGAPSQLRMTPITDFAGAVSEPPAYALMLGGVNNQASQM